MCLLLLAFRTHPDAPLILGGNRDEFFSRPTRPPHLLQERPRIVGGLDLEAGGTWMGRNEHGLVAALTNRRITGVDAGAFRSRGTIVLELLRHTGPEEAARWLASLPVAEYRPFNVLFGDTAHWYYFSSLDDRRPRPLDPGTYALSNATLDDASWPKVSRSHAFLARAAGLPGEAYLGALQAFLCDPPDAPPLGVGRPGRPGALPMDVVLVDTPGYGTVSASVITAGGTLGTRYYHADGDALRQARDDWAGDALTRVLGRQVPDGDPADWPGNPFQPVEPRA